MLQYIRDHAQGVVVWTIVGLIIITFALFGLSSYLSGSSSSFVASINGTEIDANEYRREYQNYQARLQQMLGKNYRADLFNSEMMKREVINGLITRELVTQYLEDQDYFISAGRLVAELHNINAFKGEDDQFSKERYREVLSQQGMSRAFFERQLARDIAARYLQNGVTQSDFATAHETESAYRLDNQQRDIGYLIIDKQTYLKTVQADDSEVQAYYDANKSAFMTQEKLSIEYVELKLEDIAKRYEIDEETIKDHYAAHRASYLDNPEQRKVRHILIKVDDKTDEQSALKKIKTMQELLQNGADFADLAKKASQDPGSARQGGDLGFFGRGVMDKAFEKAAFSLKKGEISQPVRSTFGYHLIKLDEVKAEKLKPLKQVREQIKKELQVQQAEQEFYTDADHLNNISYEQPDSLAPVAEKLDLEIKVSPLFGRAGGQGLLANQKIISAAFSDEVLNTGRNSDMVEIGDTHLVVLRRKEYKPSEQKPLAQVKAQIQTKLKDKAARTAIQQQVDAALARLKQAEKPETVAKAIKGAKWQRSGYITRTGTKEQSDKAKQLNQSIRQYSYTLSHPRDMQVNWGKLNLPNGDGVVVGLFAVKQAEAKDKTAQLQQQSQRIAQSQGSDVYAQLLEQLRQQADIRINLPQDGE